jgi:putative CocE/NonD family hydrolase
MGDVVDHVGSRTEWQRWFMTADGGAILMAGSPDGGLAWQPVRPGEVYEYRIDLGATSQVFKAGHRIRIDVASSNFPCYDRNSGTGKPTGEVTDADSVPADQRVFVGPDHPSSVRPPVIAPAS